MKKEIKMSDLIRWVEKRLADERKKRELPKDKSDKIQIGGKIKAFKEMKALLKDKWIEV